MYNSNSKYPWPLSLVVIAPSKGGKTHLVCSMPKVLILGTDPQGMETVWYQTGYMPTDAEKAAGKWKFPNGGQYVQVGRPDPTETMKLLDTYTDKLIKENLPVESVALDGISFFSEAARGKSAPGKSHTIEEPGQLRIQHWGFVSAHLLELLGRWREIMPKYHTVITALSDVRADPLSTRTNKQGEPDPETKIFPDVHTGVRNALASYVAHAGYLETTGSPVTRVLWFQHSRAICGSSNPNLIKVISPTFDKVYSSIYEPFLKELKQKTVGGDTGKPKSGEARGTSD